MQDTPANPAAAPSGSSGQVTHPGTGQAPEPTQAIRFHTRDGYGYGDGYGDGDGDGDGDGYGYGYGDGDGYGDGYGDGDGGF